LLNVSSGLLVRPLTRKCLRRAHYLPFMIQPVTCRCLLRQWRIPSSTVRRTPTSIVA
jgi:hypothetical protein